MPKYDYGFIGAGRMATALAGGIVEGGIAAGKQIIAGDPNEAVGQAFADAIVGANVTSDNTEVAQNSSVLILAVKPQIMEVALSSLHRSLGNDPLVVSIAAGITIARLESLLPTGTRVVRVMPNTPCLIGCGASGYSLGSAATRADGKMVEQMLQAVGVTFELPEPLLDGVTGLSGSGPAFVYTVIEAMADGGVAAGLPRDVSHQLATQTVAGAAKMVLKTGEPPAKLREAVASPGGTTIAGLEALEQNGLRAALLAAVKAATERSRELGK